MESQYIQSSLIEDMASDSAQETYPSPFIDFDDDAISWLIHSRDESCSDGSMCDDQAWSYFDPTLENPCPVPSPHPPASLSLSPPASQITEEQTTPPNSESSKPLEHDDRSKKERRRAQNRESQRAFRARKDHLVKDVSRNLSELHKQLHGLKYANGKLSELAEYLQTENRRLESENETLRGTPQGRALIVCKDNCRRRFKRLCDEFLADVDGVDLDHI